MTRTMLKLFFHRDSKFIRALEAVGAVLFIPIIIKGDCGVIFWLYLFAYLLIRFSGSFNWYRSFTVDGGQWTVDRKDELGIRLHFKKALVAASYIIFIVNAAFLLTGKMAVLYVGLGLFAMVLYLHAILLYLHFRDKDERPPNYFNTERPLSAHRNPC